ncbi:hypothetical protein [Pseudidiomarina homiensis]|uniref:hypothetical protein n=1 Tax=Pseudidiomarina homiensis TaxID=364198 RepID=UPI00215B4068|nr:hypothetical protein [Pseudidiomarina homiensis]
MPPLKWMRVKRVRLNKHKVNKAKLALATAALLVNGLSWAQMTSVDGAMGYNPFAQAAQTTTCEAGDEIISVWLPQQGAEIAKSVLQRWQSHPLARLSDCLEPRYYTTAASLQCTASGERQHMRCDLPLLPHEVTQRHIVFTQAEIASASTTQMVLPLTAQLSVFAHEMAHWLGFADEYEMSPSLAQHYCSGRYNHPSLNVVTTQQQELSSAQLKQLWRRLPWRDAVSDWRILGQQQADGYWRLGSAKDSDVGLFASKTCAGVAGVYSWKPVARLTAMEYHDVNYWPAVYLETALKLQRRSGLRDHNNWAE